MIGKENVDANTNPKATVSQNAVNNGENNGNKENFAEISEEDALLLTQKMKPFRIIEIIFIILIICGFGFIWVKILQKPVPKGILRLFGMDDTLYPEQYEKMLNARQQAQH